MMIERPLLAALNHLLASAPWARARLSPFAGRRARCLLPPIGVAFEVTSDGFLAPVEEDPAVADVLIRLPDDTPFKLAQGLEKAMAQASVEGNAEFATALSFVFRNLRWDFEEDLSRFVGDVAAHRLVLAASRLADWQRRAVTNLAENLAEYLLHENRLLAPRDELNALREGIARLNGELARVESRLASIKR